MTLPATITICGHTFTVEPLSTMQIGGAGACNTVDQTISIASDMHAEQQATTLLHEAIEAINTACQIGLKHRQIAVLETALYELLCQNEGWWE